MMLKEFSDLLRNDMDDIQADYGTAVDAAKFAIWVGWKLFGLEPRQIVDDLLLHVDSLRGVAVLGYFDSNSDTANIVTCWYEGKRNGSQVDRQQLQSLKDLWLSIKDRRISTTSAADEFVLELDDRGLSVGFAIYIVTDAEFSQDAYHFAQEQSMQLTGLSRLKDAYMKMQHPLRVKEPEKLEFTASGLQAFKGPPITVKGAETEPISTLVCALPLDLIHEWVSKFGNGLFAENLRLRLREDDKNALELEQSIQRTIFATPELMFVQNNGITITCARIELDPDILEYADKASETHIALYKPQIVNGCQTSWAIHNAVEHMQARSGQRFPLGFVLTKVIETKNPDLAQKITSASNRQNAIQSRDQKVKDQRQLAISMHLAGYAPNLGIYWDYLRGGWSNIMSKGEDGSYRVRGSHNLYRKMNNGMAGQIILAMAGALHDAKNKGGQIFDSERLYEVAFGYDLKPATRFEGLPSPKLNSGEDNALITYVDDLLFGFAIYQHATAAFKWLYADRDHQLKRKLDQVDSTQTRKELEKAIELISGREFVKYWVFDVVRLVHLIVGEWVAQGRKREDVRQSLVGNLTIAASLDPLFLPKQKRPKLFRMENDLSMPNTLDRMRPSEELPLLGCWFSSLEELGGQVIGPLREREPNVSARAFILSRTTTHTEFVKLLERELKSAMFSKLFPPEIGR